MIFMDITSNITWEGVWWKVDYFFKQPTLVHISIIRAFSLDSWNHQFNQNYKMVPAAQSNDRKFAIDLVSLVGKVHIKLKLNTY